MCGATMRMWQKNSLFVSILGAAMIFVVLWLALASFSIFIHFSRIQEDIFGIFLLIVPIATAGWWLFKRRQLDAPRREARIVAIVFAAFTPLAAIIAIPLADIFGSYSSLLGRPFGLIGAAVTVWILLTLTCFAGCSIALWIARRRGDGGSHHLP